MANQPSTFNIAMQYSSSVQRRGSLGSLTGICARLSESQAYPKRFDVSYFSHFYRFSTGMLFDFLMLSMTEPPFIIGVCGTVCKEKKHIYHLK